MDVVEKIKKLVLEKDCSVTIRTIAHHYQIALSEARRALNQLAEEAGKEDLEFYYTVSGVKIQNEDLENNNEYKQSLIKQVKDTEVEEFVKLLKPGYIKTVYAVRKPNESPFKLSNCYQNLFIKGTQELNKLGYISIEGAKETKESNYKTSQTSESIIDPKIQESQSISKEANNKINKDKNNKTKETPHPPNNSTNTKPKVKKGQTSIANFLATNAHKSSSKNAAPKIKTKSKKEETKTKESIDKDVNDKKNDESKYKDNASTKENIKEETIKIEAEDKLNINNNNKNDEDSKDLNIFTDEDEINEHSRREIIEKEEDKLKHEEVEINLFSSVKTKKKSKAQNKSKKMESKSVQSSFKPKKAINKKDKKFEAPKNEEEDDIIVEKVAEYSDDDDFIKHAPFKHRNSRIIDDDEDAQRPQKSRRNKNKRIKDEESEEELQSNTSLVGSPSSSRKLDILEMLPAKKDKEGKDEKANGDKKRRRTNEIKSIMVPDGKGGFKVTHDYVYVTNDEIPEKNQNTSSKNNSPQVDLTKSKEEKSKKPKPNTQSKGKQTTLSNFFKPKPK